MEKKSRMKAAFMYGPKNIQVKETDIPTPKKDEALVKVKHCGVCPSDLKYYLGHKQYLPYGEPSLGLTGHEWVGEVIEVGHETDKVSVGDHIIPDVIVPCGECKFCRRGKTNLCANKKNVMRGYAEYATVPIDGLYKKPDGLSDKEACMAEPVAVCLNGNARSNISEAEDVAIIGAGPIGLIHLQLAKMKGVRLIVSDLHDKRLDLAKKLGADEIVNPTKEDVVRVVKDLTDGYGADSVIVATGNKEAMEQALNMVSVGGTVNLFAGRYPPIKIDLDPNRIHYGEINLTGSYDSTPYFYRRALKLMKSGAIQIEPLVSHDFPLDQVQAAYEIVRKQEGVKVIVTP